jgi:hypothetical protein
VGGAGGGAGRRGLAVGRVVGTGLGLGCFGCCDFDFEGAGWGVDGDLVERVLVGDGTGCVPGPLAGGAAGGGTTTGGGPGTGFPGTAPGA